MKTLNFSTLLFAAAVGLLGLPAGAGATAPAAAGNSLAVGLAAAYEERAASLLKSPRLPDLAFEDSDYSEDELNVKSEDGATNVQRVSRLQEPGEAMGGGKERKDAAAKKTTSDDKE